VDTTLDRARRLAAAEAIAREAGARALALYRAFDRRTIERKGLQDLVSAADREVETLIRARIAALYPEDGVLGEEQGLAPARSGALWVVDPIDGTWCFVNGIGSWCVSIACVEDGRITIGAIFDPVSGELFSAAEGAGARLDGVPIRVSDASSLAEGTVSTGFSPRSDGSEIAPLIGELLAMGGMFHRHGSGALALAWTACGRLVGYLEPHMNSWDCLAGLLLVREAGGFTNDFLADGGLEAGNCVVAGPKQLEAALGALAGRWFRKFPPRKAAAP
jgi:myo-inositol-1(or 4)-monophosphatase